MTNIYETSWGYDMTINEYCKVLENTGKTLKCVMVKKKVENDDGLGNGRSTPDQEICSKPFRLKAVCEKWSGINDTGRYHLSIRGSYPYCNEHKQFGYFHIWEGQPNYENTWD